MPKKEKKDRVIKLSVSESEYALFQENFRRFGMRSLSEFGRESMLFFSGGLLGCTMPAQLVQRNVQNSKNGTTVNA